MFNPKQYKKYVEDCLTDPNFDITHLEDYESWLEVEGELTSNTDK